MSMKPNLISIVLDRFVPLIHTIRRKKKTWFEFTFTPKPEPLIFYTSHSNKNFRFTLFTLKSWICWTLRIWYNACRSLFFFVIFTSEHKKDLEFMSISPCSRWRERERARTGKAETERRSNRCRQIVYCAQLTKWLIYLYASIDKFQLSTYFMHVLWVCTLRPLHSMLMRLSAGNHKTTTEYKVHR